MRTARELTLITALLASPILLANPTVPSATPLMKAVVIHEYGGPEVLKYEDIPRPEPNDDQLLIRVIAAGVNPVDASIRSGKYAELFGTKLPFTPGFDVAGVVEKTGAKIRKFMRGEPAYAMIDLKDGGGYADYAIATELGAAS